MWLAQEADQAIRKLGDMLGLLGCCGCKARKQSPEVGSSSPRIPEQGGGRAGLGSGLLACQSRALFSLSSPSLPGRDQMFSLL